METLTKEQIDRALVEIHTIAPELAHLFTPLRLRKVTGKLALFLQIALTMQSLAEQCAELLIWREKFELLPPSDLAQISLARHAARNREASQKMLTHFIAMYQEPQPAYIHRVFNDDLGA